MLIIGHRGACGYAPENTLISFQKALELGVDMVELDVYRLASGELVVLHDDKVDRTTNGHGYLWNFTFEELRKLDAGAGQQVPTLEEVLDTVSQRVPVNIELKGVGTAQAVAARIGQYTNERGWSAKAFMVSSFNHPELQAFKRLQPEIDVAALTGTIPLHYAEYGTELQAVAVNPTLEFVDQAFVDDAHARGMKVFVYTVNAADDALRMRALGVDGVFTNYPDVVREALT